eukprot:snap_masked-scaffold_3-processed-gene-9.30-mRNA-1 protein AED:1.00 eAED:1.00 QI:0/0/0/0/1/1/4/0/110
MQSKKQAPLVNAMHGAQKFKQFLLAHRKPNWLSRLESMTLLDMENKILCTFESGELNESFGRLRAAIEAKEFFCNWLEIIEGQKGRLEQTYHIYKLQEVGQTLAQSLKLI